MCLGIYHFTISIFAFIPKEEKKIKRNKKHSFALITSAHNEEAVIANLVHSLENLEYDKSKYDIFVIADNCVDNTAKVAREAGAKVFERFDEKRGKGFALEWMFEKLFKMKRKYDFVAIFDADNLVSEKFLTSMNNKVNQGHRVVQGYLDSKNPNDTWISYVHSMTYWIMNAFYQRARYNIGLSNQLGGTGFIMATELIKEYGWQATCLTEDLEFSMKLALQGEKVAWANDAIVYDEKPLTFKASWNQRKRWMQGNADVCFRFAPKLFAKGTRENKLFLFDNCLYMVQPMIFVVSTILMIMFGIVNGITGNEMSVGNVIPAAITTVIFAVNFIWPIVVMALDKKFNKNTLIGYLVFLAFSFTWIPLIIMGVIGRKNTEWSHTKHTQSVTIHEVA